MCVVHKGVDIQHTYGAFYSVKALDEFQQVTSGDTMNAILNVF